MSRETLRELRLLSKAKYRSPYLHARLVDVGGICEQNRKTLKKTNEGATCKKK